MSDGENKLLKKITEIEKLLLSKETELASYKNQLLQLSHQLDEMMSTSETELGALRKLFQHLVPTELPHINGFEFSRKFVYGTQAGGDYFDLFLNKDKFKWSLLISAAENYTTSATLLSQIIGHASSFSSPDSTTTKVSSFLKDLFSTDPSIGEFSLFYGQVDRRVMTFEVCCLGKIHGVITTGTGSSGTGQPTGMTQIISAESPGEKTGASTQVKTITLDLVPKSKVCFVTPGVLEVLPIQKIASICKSMAAQDVHNLRNEIFFQAEQQSGRSQPLRDQIVFVFEVKDNFIKIAK